MHTTAVRVCAAWWSQSVDRDKDSQVGYQDGTFKHVHLCCNATANFAGKKVGVWTRAKILALCKLLKEKMKEKIG